MFKESPYSYALQKCCLYFKSSVVAHKRILVKILLTVLYKRMCSLVIKRFKL